MFIFAADPAPVTPDLFHYLLMALRDAFVVWLGLKVHQITGGNGNGAN